MAHGVCHVWRTSTTMASEASARLLIMRLAWARVSERVSEFSTAALSGVPDKTQSLSEALGGLQLLERAVVHLAHSAYSRQEIANILGISCESVDDRLASARSALHDWLASTYRAESKAPASDEKDRGIQRFGGQVEMRSVPSQ
jgi:DNA-directed RNA polymerase specialized sigma24 family protein